MLPSWKKMWDGLKEGSVTPSSWLQTDRVMLNSLRWSGAFLCGICEHWSTGKYVSQNDGEAMRQFFSPEMERMRRILQYVKWNVSEVKGSRDLVSIRVLGADGHAQLSGELCTAYGTGFDWYSVSDPYNLESYSYEFNSLVSSYPANDKESQLKDRDSLKVENRESLKTGLAHSLVLAKHLKVEKLKAIRQYYENYRVPLYQVRYNVFQLLKVQTQCRIRDDAEIWTWIFGSYFQKIPLFPYRMQAVALWDEATNRRVLQASAHQDIWNSLEGSGNRRSRRTVSSLP